MEDQKEIYFTDMYLVAALVSYSPLSFVRVDKTDPKRQQFYFKDEKILEVFIMSPSGPEKKRDLSLDEFKVWYDAGILLFKGNYPECIRKIKSRIYSDS